MKVDFNENLLTDLINLYNLVNTNKEELKLTYSQKQSMNHLGNFISYYAMQEKQELTKVYPKWNGVVILQITKDDFNQAQLLEEIHYARLNHVVILCSEQLMDELTELIPQQENIHLFTYDSDDPRYDIMKKVYKHFGHLHSVTIPIF